MRGRFLSHRAMNFILIMSFLVLLLVPSASSQRVGKASHLESLPDSNHRRMTRANDDIRWRMDLPRREPTLRQLKALERLRRHIEGLEVRFDPVTAVPHHLFSLSRRLTPPRSDDPVVIARDFLKAHRELFRLQNQEIDDLVVVKNYRTRHNGVTHLVFKQFYKGLDVFQGHIKVNIDREGCILSVSGYYFPGLVASLNPGLSAEEAVRIAARRIAPDINFALTPKGPARGIERATVFDRGPFTDDITAKLVIFPIIEVGRLAWKVRLHLMDRLIWYDTLVDAQTGEILFRYNLYKFDEPRGLVFEINPDVGPQVLKSFVGDPVASPETWVASLPNVATRGNNVITLPLAEDAEQDFAFPFRDIYQSEGANSFDLDRRTLRFTPNAEGGYDVDLLPLDFDRDLGEKITDDLKWFGLFSDPNNGSARFDLGFAFPFFGRTYKSIFINADGFVTLGSDDSDLSESWADLILGPPRIAVLWDDLNPGEARGQRGLFVKRARDRVVITWNRVPEFIRTGANTVQLTLFDTGVIDIAFVRVGLSDALVGLSRGWRAFELQPVDFSAEVPIRGQRHGFAEKFPTRELDVAITNLFYHLNFMHDYLYELGFDEPAGNFQFDNFGRGGLGNDPVFAAPQHSGFNNAFFGTPEDGRAPFTGYSFFTDPPFRQVDSDLDADIIYHEYVHGLTTRLVGNPFDVTALFGTQSGAMAEGWSDIYSVSITDDPITGEYSTGDPETGIRTVNYARSRLMYGDLGNRFGPVSTFFSDDIGGIHLDRTFIPQVHWDGEIWASVLWDLRTRLGRATFEQLITDALKLTPSIPSMLDGRDAILLADVASNEGANVATIWTVFAARGMGVSAQAGDGNDTIVFQAFDTPADPLLPDRETIFFDDMESGSNGWTIEGDDGHRGQALWHQSDRRGSTAWYYGRESTGTYDTGQRNFGALTSPVIDLPRITGRGGLMLEFDHFMRTEDASRFFDNGYVRVIDVATGEVTQVACVINGTVGGFERERINLSAFAGRSIRIQFYFDTLDAWRNDAEGWYIDNVRISRYAR